MSRERTGAKPSMFQRAFSSILEEPPEPEPLIAAASAPHPVPELLSVTSAGVDSAHAEGEAGIGNVSLRLGQHSASVNARAESTDGRTTSSASRASQAGDVALAAEVDGPGEEQQEAEQHGWAVNFVVSRIGVPKKLWQGLVMQPDGRMQTCDPQSRRGIFGLHILSPFHPIAVAWVSFMLLFDLIYTAFWLPLSVAFCVETYGASLDIGCTQGNFIGGLIYTLNLLVSFQIGAVLENDYEDYVVDKDGWLLAKCYVRYGRFALDLVGVMPFIALLSVLHSSDDTDPNTQQTINLVILILSLVRLLRLGRLVSISKMVYMGAMGHGGLPLSVTSSYIILLLYMLAVVINLSSCIMLMIATLEGKENSWMTSLTFRDFTQGTSVEQWYYAIYWMITTITISGYGDVTPKSIPEMVVANVCMLSGVIISGLLISTISNATNTISMDARRWTIMRKKIDTTVQWLQAHKAEDVARKKIKSYLVELWETQEEYNAEGEVFGSLPHYLRQELARHATVNIVSSIKMFRNQDQGLKQLLAQYLKPVDAVPGSTLCEQGDEGDCLWVLSEGSLQVTQYLGDRLTVTADPEHPCILGDNVLLQGEAPMFRYRCFTIRAELDGGALHTNSVNRQLWELQQSAIGPLLALYPHVRQDLLNYVRDRTIMEVGLGESLMSGHDYSGWCEAAASLSRAIRQQLPEVQDLTVELLGKAKAEDGSLQQLLDSLLEYSLGTGSPAVNFPALSSRHTPATDTDATAAATESAAAAGASPAAAGPGADAGAGADAGPSVGAGPGQAPGLLPPALTASSSSNVLMMLNSLNSLNRTSRLGWQQVASPDLDVGLSPGPAGVAAALGVTVTGTAGAGAGAGAEVGAGAGVAAAVWSAEVSGLRGDLSTLSVPASRAPEFRALLGLPPQAAPSWRPSRVGRQTLLRTSHRPPSGRLSTTSIPVFDVPAPQAGGPSPGPLPPAHSADSAQQRSGNLPSTHSG